MAIHVGDITELKVQQIFIQFMCEHLTNNAEVEELKKMFQKIDVNSDGTLDVEEVTRSLRELGFANPEA